MPHGNNIHSFFSAEKIRQIGLQKVRIEKELEGNRFYVKSSSLFAKINELVVSLVNLSGQIIATWGPGPPKGSVFGREMGPRTYFREI